MLLLRRFALALEALGVFALLLHSGGLLLLLLTLELLLGDLAALLALDLFISVLSLAVFALPGTWLSVRGLSRRTLWSAVDNPGVRAILLERLAKTAALALSIVGATVWAWGSRLFSHDTIWSVRLAWAVGGIRTIGADFGCRSIGPFVSFVVAFTSLAFAGTVPCDAGAIRTIDAWLINVWAAWFFPAGAIWLASDVLVFAIGNAVTVAVLPWAVRAGYR